MTPRQQIGAARTFGDEHWVPLCGTCNGRRDKADPRPTVRAPDDARCGCNGNVRAVVLLRVRGAR